MMLDSEHHLKTVQRLGSPVSKYRMTFDRICKALFVDYRKFDEIYLMKVKLTLTLTLES